MTLVSRFCHMSSVRSTSDCRGPVTRKRVPDREEQGKPSKDARRGRCHPLEAGFWPLWMTPLPRTNITEYRIQNRPAALAARPRDPGGVCTGTTEPVARWIHCKAQSARTHSSLRDPLRGKRDAKWAEGSRSQTHRRAAMGGFTQDRVCVVYWYLVLGTQFSILYTFMYSPA